MNTNDKAAARFYLKQIFCTHRHYVGVQHNVFEQGIRVKFVTKMCVRCGRHKRVDNHS